MQHTPIPPFPPRTRYGSSAPVSDVHVVFNAQLCFGTGGRGGGILVESGVFAAVSLRIENIDVIPNSPRWACWWGGYRRFVLYARLAHGTGVVQVVLISRHRCSIKNYTVRRICPTMRRDQ